MYSLTWGQKGKKDIEVGYQLWLPSSEEWRYGASLLDVSEPLGYHDFHLDLRHLILVLPKESINGRGASYPVRKIIHLESLLPILV